MDLGCLHLPRPCSPPQSCSGKPFAGPPSVTRENSRLLLIPAAENLTLQCPEGNSRMRPSKRRDKLSGCRLCITGAIRKADDHKHRVVSYPLKIL